jgi:hypothetical protein
MPEHHHRTVAYTTPPTLGYLAQAGILDLIATCHHCNNVAVVALEEVIEKVGPDRPLVSLKGRCSVCGSNRGELRPHR